MSSQPRVRAGDRIPVAATDLDFEGRGIGAGPDGLEIHVEGLLPGERAEVELEHVSRQARRAFGRVLALGSDPASDRVAPACPDRCGGCAWQPLAYPAQLEHKRRRVERALSDALGAAAPTVPAVVPAPAQIGYRNKAIYVLAPRDGPGAESGSGSGSGVALGAWAPRSHRWIDTSTCRVVVPAIQEVVPHLARALERPELSVHDERTRAGCLRYAVLRANQTGRVLVGLVTTSDAPRDALASAAAALAGACAHVSGVVWNRNDATGGVVLGATTEPLLGAATLEERVAGVAIDIAIDTFVQVNLDQAEAIYRRLADLVAAGPDTRAVDLYCGAGAIAFTLAHRGARCVGVERNPVAVEAARRAASRAQLTDRVSFEAAPADAAERSVAEAAADLVVVNPPRQGLAPAVRAYLARSGPARVAYVSCGPESLARDLVELTSAGYAVAALEPFDLMPGTAHVETLAILERC